MAIQLPNVWQKAGKTYFRRKVKGKTLYTPLPAPDHPTFAIEYQRAKTGADVAVVQANREPIQIARGSFAALIGEYRASAEYAVLKPGSKKIAEIYLRLFEKRFGQRLVKDMTPPVVDRLRDEYASTPAKANGFISWLRILLNLGIRRGYCASNATAGIRMMKTGEHQPWPEDVIDRAIKAADPTLRIAIVTGLCSGQRISDCVRMRHDQFDLRGRLPLIQKKTGKRVLIPVHPRWKSEMESAPAGEWVVNGARGGQQSENTIQVKLRDLFKDLGITGYTFHGLRKNATNYLTEVGLTPVEVGVITGMSIEMVQHYTRSIAQNRVIDIVEERVKRGALPGGDTTLATG